MFTVQYVAEALWLHTSHGATVNKLITFVCFPMTAYIRDVLPLESVLLIPHLSKSSVLTLDLSPVSKITLLLKPWYLTI